MATEMRIVVTFKQTPREIQLYEQIKQNYSSPAAYLKDLALRDIEHDTPGRPPLYSMDSSPKAFFMDDDELSLVK